MKRVSAFVVLLMITVAVNAQESKKTTMGTFTQAEMSQWKERSFKKNTNYQLAGNVLEATCEDQASVLYRKISIDLSETPMLHWSWRVDSVHPQLDDTVKAGDDYAVRLYVVNAANSIFPWRAKAVNYVWANSQPKGATWPSAFTGNDIMIATQSGNPAAPEKWVTEVRNVREDFKNHFGEDLTTIDSVAIMTDCDNSKLPSKGYYRDIWFSAE
ncbi:MAG: DUF3047 domain-containing protein [Kordiimonadaceae bacterium]|nr:DUF3047 domain-containing protein [Kordiimonadaceae bacterium]MBT6330217.1 DUF3047 domain-containing protein [Kordiimonadaceae bacterium]